MDPADPLATPPAAGVSAPASPANAALAEAAGDADSPVAVMAVRGTLPAPKRHRRWPWVVAALALALATAGAVGFRPFVRWLVVREAAARGILLTLGQVRVGWARVEVLDFQFEPARLDGVRGRAQRIGVALDGFEPKALDASGVELELEGSAPALALALSSWAKDHPKLFKVPARASAVSVTWRPAPEAAPWLAVRNASIEPVGPGGRFVASSVEVFGVDVGTTGASWGGDDTSVTFGFGEPDVEQAPVRIDVRHASTEPEAVIVLRPTKLERLAGPLGVELPVSGVTASARAELRFVGPGSSGAVRGSLSVDLDGFRPPMPPELRALVFGDDTHFEAEVEVAADRSRVELRKAIARHGSFELEGQGAVVRQPTHAIVTFDLAGSLACSDLARVVAGSKVGSAVGAAMGTSAGAQAGRLAGIAAGIAIKGSVAIGLGLELDTRRLADAKVRPRIGIGCGLADFGRLARDLDDLARGVEDVAADLGLPRLPDLRPKRR